MKVVNAIWDERNFGIKCAEVELEHDDDKTTIMKS